MAIPSDVSENIRDLLYDITNATYARKLAQCRDAVDNEDRPPFSEANPNQDFMQGVIAYKKYAATQNTPRTLQSFVREHGFNEQQVAQYEKKYTSDRCVDNDQSNLKMALVEAATGCFNLTPEEYEALKTASLGTIAIPEDMRLFIGSIRRLIMPYNHKEFMEVVKQFHEIDLGVNPRQPTSVMPEAIAKSVPERAPVTPIAVQADVAPTPTPQIEANTAEQRGRAIQEANRELLVLAHNIETAQQSIKKAGWAQRAIADVLHDMARA